MVIKGVKVDNLNIRQLAHHKISALIKTFIEDSKKNNF